MQRLPKTILGKFSPVKPQTIGSYPCSLRIILACLRYPSRALSLEGACAGGGVVANTSSAASSRINSSSTTASVPGMHSSAGAHNAAGARCPATAARRVVTGSAPPAQRAASLMNQAVVARCTLWSDPSNHVHGARSTRRAWTQRVTDHGPHWGDLLRSSPSLARVTMCVSWIASSLEGRTPSIQNNAKKFGLSMVIYCDFSS